MYFKISFTCYWYHWKKNKDFWRSGNKFTFSSLIWFKFLHKKAKKYIANNSLVIMKPSFSFDVCFIKRNLPFLNWLRSGYYKYAFESINYYDFLFQKISMCSCDSKHRCIYLLILYGANLKRKRNLILSMHRWALAIQDFQSEEKTDERCQYATIQVFQSENVVPWS